MAYKIVRWIENTLIRHSDFALSGRKELMSQRMVVENVIDLLKRFKIIAIEIGGSILA